MPQTIKKYRIFLASPSDVKQEREVIDEVISELNRTYGNRFNLTLELLKWETHAAPASSSTQTQDIIDGDIGFDYDLFIGILWMKFGTPTIQFSSGTEQEFQNAYDRFKKSPSSLQILFYFKTASPPSLLDIIPSQLEKVNNFRNSLGDKSVLYWEYNSIEDLQKYLRLHIPFRIDYLDSTQNKIEYISSNQIIPVIEEREVDELGIFDYQEIYTEAFADCTSALVRISEATTWIGGEISKKASELNKLNSVKPEIGKKVMRDFYKETAEVMNTYASRLKPEILIYIDSFEKGANAFTSMIGLHRSDINELSQEEAAENKGAITSLVVGIDNGFNGMNEFYDAITKLPRMEKDLNKARNNVEDKLKDLLTKMDASRSIAIEMLKTFE